MHTAQSLEKLSNRSLDRLGVDPDGEKSNNNPSGGRERETGASRGGGGVRSNWKDSRV